MYRYFHLLLIAALPLLSQPAPGLLSPEVRDGKVTFRVKAPNAQKVELSLEGNGRHAMTKNEEGVWSMTTETLTPDIYGYSFNIDGVGFVDPSNGQIKTNALSINSAVLVPGQPALPWEQTDVPHGTVHHHFYESKIASDKRDFFVYTPPGYEAKKKYPLLVLLHGFSDYADGWTTVGKANLIFDNLLAKGEIKPLVVVMPLGYGVSIDTLRTGIPRDMNIWRSNASKFGEALLSEVLPLAEKSYGIEKNREKRAITGLSMGGAEALLVGLNHLDQFAYVGAFSAGGGGNNPSETFPALSEKDNGRMKLLWMACGVDDRLIEGNRKLSAWLKEKNVKHTWVETPGAHTWLVWRRYLSDFSKLLTF